MVKKAVGKVKSQGSKSRAQVIIPMKSYLTGAYTFSKFVVPTEEVNSFVAQKTR